MSSDDSESEDCPRHVLDVGSKFTVQGLPHVEFKLEDLQPEVLKKHDIKLPFPCVLFPRPKPHPGTVAHTKFKMGGGQYGVWMGTEFKAPPGYWPEQVFAARPINTLSAYRVNRFMIRRRHVPNLSNLKTMFVFTDGCCLDNGREAPRAGFAFVFNNDSGNEGILSAALERTGPDARLYRHTSNRAKLRAVLAALQFRFWPGEGWHRIVIVTDSEYAAKGATEWLGNWARRDWKVAVGTSAKNQDLWKKMSELMGESAEAGCEVSFWRVPRLWNAVADMAAKNAAQTGHVEERYTVHTKLYV